MLEIFQGETGGKFSFPLKGIPAVSGYMLIYGYSYNVDEHYKVNGTISSGNLEIYKSDIPQLAATEYIIFVRAEDEYGMVYMVTPEELKVIRVR